MIRAKNYENISVTVIYRKLWTLSGPGENGIFDNVTTTQSLP